MLDRVMLPHRNRVRFERAIDPVAVYLKRSGAFYSWGLGHDGEPLATPAECKAEIVSRLKVLLGQLLPGSPEAPNLDPLRSVIGSVRRADLFSGKARPIEYVETLVALVAFMAGVREHLIDCEREAMVLAQLLHDPRVRKLMSSNRVDQARARKRKSMSSRIPPRQPGAYFAPRMCKLISDNEAPEDRR